MKLMRAGVGTVLVAVTTVLAGCDESGKQQPDPTTSATTSETDTSTSSDDTTATLNPTSDPTSDEDATSTTTEDTATPADTTEEVPNKLGDRLTFATETITVPAGDERQVCKVVNIPGDKAVDIVRIESRMHGKSHHFNLYKVINDDKLKPASEAEGATHDCPPAGEQLAGDAAYIYGSATPDRVMATPAGVAFHLEPGQRLILEYHGLNYTPDDTTGNVEVDLVAAAPDVTIEHHADIMWMANWGFLLPEGESHDTAGCNVPYDVEVFSVMSHFHELGTKFEIETKLEGAYEKVYETDDWSHPLVEKFDPPIEMKAGDGFRWTCTWDNWRGHMVQPGKLSTDEMCMIFAAAYPKDSLSADPIQCNILF